MTNKFSDFDLFKMDTLIRAVGERALFLVNFGGEHGAVLAAKTEQGVLPMARLLSDEEINHLPVPSDDTEVVEMRVAAPSDDTKVVEMRNDD